MTLPPDSARSSSRWWWPHSTNAAPASPTAASTLTLETTIGDTLEVVNHLRARFHQGKIYLVGNSWGSLVGVLVVQRDFRTQVLQLKVPGLPRPGTV